MTRRTDRGGFTLIELLVVIAIISIMVAVSVPTLSRLGLFGRDAVNTGAREVLTMLKAARVFASANHVDTAVVYSLGARKDSRTGQIVPVIDGIAMVRRLTLDEWKRLQDLTNPSGPFLPATLASYQGSETADMLPFIPVNADEGVFKKIPEGAAVMPQIFNFNPLDGSDYPGRDSGLSAIRVFMPQKSDAANPLDQMLPIPVDPSNSATRLDYSYYLRNSDYLNPDSNLVPAEPYKIGRFPAHVFKQNALVQSDSPKMRFVVPVGPAPDAQTNMRFNDSGVALPTANVELYATTGRAQVES